MKKMISIIPVLVATLFLMSSCTKYDNCSSKKIGDIPLSTRADNFIVYVDDQEVIFINQEGEELKYNVSATTRGDRNIDVEKIGEASSLNVGTYDCHSYYQKYEKSNNFHTNQSEISLRINVTNESLVINKNEERVNFSLSNSYAPNIGQQQVTGHYFYDEDRFVDDSGDFNGYMSKVEELDLNGQIFTDVLSSSNEHGTIYVKENLGIIGFKIAEDVWVLK